LGFFFYWVKYFCHSTAGFRPVCEFSAILVSRCIVLVADQQKSRLLHSSAAQSYDHPPLTDHPSVGAPESSDDASCHHKSETAVQRAHGTLSSNDQSRATSLYRWQRNQQIRCVLGHDPDRVNNIPSNPDVPTG